MSLKQKLVDPDTGEEFWQEWSDPVGTKVEQIDRDGCVVAGTYMGGERWEKKADGGGQEKRLSTVHRIRVESLILGGEHSNTYAPGSILFFWGSALLDGLLEGLQGKRVRIEYKGRDRDERQMKRWDVRVAVRP